MKKNILLISITAVVTFLLVFFTGKYHISDQDYRAAFSEKYGIFTPELPQSLDFAGEDVPLGKYYVRESLDRELLVNTYFHSSSIIMIKRAYRWFPYIESILKEQNVPADFKYMALIESNLSNVYSYKEAGGFWQLMPSTATHYGLEISDYADERFNIRKATEVACTILKDSYARFGSWTIAAAAYNAGNRRLQDALGNQRTGSYYDLYLNDETSRFVFRILAMKLIMENPTAYGFFLREKDLYPPIPFTEYELDTAISDLPGFAISRGMNYRILKDFNPWIRGFSLPADTSRVYRLCLPDSGYLNYESLFNRENMYNLWSDTVK